MLKRLFMELGAPWTLSHPPPTLLIFGGLLTGMAGALLLIYSSTLAMQGRPKLAAFLLLVGLALIVAGVIIILVANL